MSSRVKTGAEHARAWRRLEIAWARFRVSNAQFGLRAAERARDPKYTKHFSEGLDRAKADLARLEERIAGEPV